MTIKYSKAKQELLDRLEFEPGQHRYTLDGFVIPGVTSVIDPYLDYGGIPKDVRDAALLRGTLVHALTEHLDKGTYDSEMIELSEAAKLEGYVYAWDIFKRDYQVVIHDIEFRVYHSKHRYCGTGDRIAEVAAVHPNIPALIDIKTGKLSPFYAWQTAAYCAAIEEGGITIPKRWAVELRENGTYHAEEHTAKKRDYGRADLPAFLGALKVAEWKIKYGH